MEGPMIKGSLCTLKELAFSDLEERKEKETVQALLLFKA